LALGWCGSCIAFEIKYFEIEYWLKLEREEFEPTRVESSGIS
jgi:hypothetical protein